MTTSHKSDKSEPNLVRKLINLKKKKKNKTKIINKSSNHNDQIMITMMMITVRKLPPLL